MTELKQKVINALENLEYYDVVNLKGGAENGRMD